MRYISQHLVAHVTAAVTGVVFSLTSAQVFAKTESPAAKLAKATSTSEIIQLAAPSDWQSIEADNLLVADFAAGTVVIELAPQFAPKHVANIRALVREGYFDQNWIVRAQENYVVQWGGDEGAADSAIAPKAIKAALTSIPGEFERSIGKDLDFTPMPDRDGFAAQTGFSHTWPVARNPKTGKTWLTHCYAMVGAGRGDALDSGSGAELYAMLTTARGLDRNVTMVGRVVQGMATLSITPRGTGAMGFYEKPEQRQAIKRVRVASDMAASERPQLEVLRSNTAAFKEYISLRRNQRNPWFRVKAGYADVCSVPPIVRAKAPAN